ncbi:MAG: T9SS type A sorting domain-containing protein [Flavobacteriales bacterium]|nr:T9SS type A sorting domain-containing protein [Flavobacteriales bacterium]
MKTLIALAATLAAGAAWPQQPFDLDPSFRFNADSWYINSTYPLPDGDVIISGVIAVPGEWPIERLGARLNPDGSIDPDFRTYPSMGGKSTPWQDQFYCEVGQVVRRFFMDGRIDSSYISIAQAPYCGFLQGGDYHVFPDGRVLVAGGHLLEDSIRGFVGLYGLIWFTNQGYLDTTRIHRRTNSDIYYLHALPDGKFLCSGYATLFDGHPLPSSTFRVMPDGALDTTFQAPEGYVTVTTSHVLASGKMLIGGNPSYLANGDTLCLMRLLPDGSMDPTFHLPLVHNYNPILGGYLMEGVNSITPLGTDKYILTGAFTEIDGEPRGGIALIDTAGYLLDDLFTGSGCGGYIWTWLDPPSPFQWMNHVINLTPAYDGSYYISGAYYGYDDGTTNDPDQRLISRLHGLNVGVEEHGVMQVQALHIAPNPCHGGAVQLSVGEVPKRATLTIHDASGRVVRQEPWPAGTVTHTLKAGLLAPGTYLLRVQEEQGTLHAGKLIVLP